MKLHTREWGRGDPVIALHPLGLESSAFGGLASDLGDLGLRTIAADLPGFGRSAAPDAPLTPARMAKPVVRLARGLGERPALVGVSMGGRVALEAALVAPEAFRSVVFVSPYLPWLRLRGTLAFARWMSPRAAGALPIEAVWPLLKAVAGVLERSPLTRDDDMAKAAARALYYASCPATRTSIVSAAREMALDPAFGPRGLWERLPGLAVPAVFVWGGRDRLVPASFARDVGRALPEARQRVLPCLRHAMTGAHHACLAEAVAQGLLAEEGVARPRRNPPAGSVPVLRVATARCRVAPSAASRRAFAGA